MKKILLSALFVALSMQLSFAVYTSDDLVQIMKENSAQIRIEEANLKQSKENYYLRRKWIDQKTLVPLLEGMKQECNLKLGYSLY